MDAIIADLVRGMERAMMEAVARRWCAVGLALGWAWDTDDDGRTILRIDVWIGGRELPILIACQAEPGWYEAFHGCGEVLAAGTARDVLDTMIYWVERTSVERPAR